MIALKQIFSIIILLFIQKAEKFYSISLAVIIGRSYTIIYFPMSYMIIIGKRHISKKETLIENSCQNIAKSIYYKKK